MKSFLFIIKKEVLALLRDRVGLIAIMIIPMLALLLFNQVVSTDMHHIIVECVVKKPSQRANEFLKPLRQNDLFIYNGTTASVDEAKELFQRNAVHAIVVVDEEFEQMLDAPTDITTKGKSIPAVQIITDNSNTVIGTTANYYIMAALRTSYAELQGKDVQQQTDNISVKMLYNPGLSSTYQFGVGVFALFIVIQCVLGCASSMVKEKERHSIDSIIISSVSTWELMLGKLFTHLILNTFVISIAFALMHWLIGMPVNGPLWVFALLTLICMLTTMLLGTYISLSSATEANALSTSITLISLPVLNLSGVIFPPDSMPDWALYISNAIYAKWYIDAARQVLLQGADITYVFKDMWFMLVNMFVFLMLCIYKLKNERWLK